ncbi:hypothetical protein BDB00DRAFT_174271 [Zychaea mexicana]|uniref:uncharacterized protein n=1 Tax=Zychaea mexicana TaxID=64656 RepID=UPI0022FE1C35|nr:uncharacterized protein BDB00DRAFT_174271 [Zychaea mexicana]KAI9479558.1 hypothetical protein BDB00DRAFT_174271 [Zychaea mexicana]
MKNNSCIVFVVNYHIFQKVDEMTLTLFYREQRMMLLLFFMSFSLLLFFRIFTYLYISGTSNLSYITLILVQKNKPHTQLSFNQCIIHKLFQRRCFMNVIAFFVWNQVNLIHPTRVMMNIKNKFIELIVQKNVGFFSCLSCHNLFIGFDVDQSCMPPAVLDCFYRDHAPSVPAQFIAFSWSTS